MRFYCLFFNCSNIHIRGMWRCWTRVTQFFFVLRKTVCKFSTKGRWAANDTEYLLYTTENQQPNIFYSAAATINYVCLMSPGSQFGDLSENNNLCTNSDTALCGHCWLSSSLLFKSVRFFLVDLLVVVVSCLANGLMYFKICPCSQVDRFGGQKSRFF